MQKVPFFCTRLRIQLHPKGRLLSLIIFYFLIYWFANFVCKESRNLSPFGKVAILGLDINQRTLNLKFSWPFFLTRWPAAGLLGCVPPLWPFCHYSAWTLSRCVLNDFWRPCLWLYFFLAIACKVVLYNPIDFTPFQAFRSVMAFVWS